MSTSNTNQMRTKRCDEALARYGNGSPDENLIDFLTDAMHWCDTTPIDFHHVLAQACRHYVNELNGEQHDERRMSPTTAAEPSVHAMPPHVFNALELVLEHFYRDELDHYESGEPGHTGHIFHSLNRLKHWVATQL
jgi:hypothetical protein